MYMSKYSESKIYKLTSSQTDKVYIGSTIKSLDVRFSNHKAHYKSWLKSQINKITSSDLLQYDDVKIELIKEFPCETRKELEKEEGKLILENNCVNKYVVGRTKKEYDKIYRHKNKEKYKEYVEANKEKINEKFTCECGGKYIYYNKSRHFKTKKHLKFVTQV
jgi:hypothetical protein